MVGRGLRSMPVAISLMHKLLLPGWAGHLAPDELENLLEELHSDKVLAFQWGFRPSAKRRAEEAIHQVAMHGAPAGRIPNLKLVRGATSGPSLPDVESPVSDTTMEIPEPEPARTPVSPRKGDDVDIPFQMPLFAGA